VFYFIMLLGGAKCSAVFREPHGRLLASGSDDNTGRLWGLP
jgi:hypothetical protein